MRVAEKDRSRCWCDLDLMPNWGDGFADLLSQQTAFDFRRLDDAFDIKFAVGSANAKKLLDLGILRVLGGFDLSIQDLMKDGFDLGGFVSLLFANRIVHFCERRREWVGGELSGQINTLRQLFAREGFRFGTPSDGIPGCRGIFDQQGHSVQILVERNQGHRGANAAVAVGGAGCAEGKPSALKGEFSSY